MIEQSVDLEKTNKRKLERIIPTELLIKKIKAIKKETKNQKRIIRPELPSLIFPSPS